MLKLYLLRHGKAANPENYAEDFDRPLNKKGVAQINQVGFKLQYDKIQFDQLISSSAERTKNTTSIANHYLGIQKVDFFRELYLARQDFILHHIIKNASSKSILYVGHNFGISDLATYLSGEHMSLTTGHLVGFEFDLDNWDEIIEGSGRLIENFSPQVNVP